MLAATHRKRYPQLQGGSLFKLLGHLHYTFPKVSWLRSMYYKKGRGGSVLRRP